MRKDDRVTSNERESFSVDGLILPNHYYCGNSYQVIDIIQDQLSDKAFIGFCKFLILKYIIKVGKMDLGSKLRSYKKSAYYLKELIERRSKTSEDINEDRINPPYFKQHELECVDIVEDQFEEEEVIGAYTGQMMRYILRAEHKHGLEDYKKAQYFLNRLIEYLKSKLDKEKK